MLSWQQQLSGAVTDLHELGRLLELNFAASPSSQINFPLRVPYSFVNRMEKGNFLDPLLLQVLPSARELAEHPGFSHDPLQEHSVNPVPGLLHKYAGRVLITSSSGCAVHCRYCFRRHFPYAENGLSKERIKNIVAYIAADPSIEEVILSGGDPLLAKDKQIIYLLKELENLSSVTRLRFHTRLPIVIPKRMTPELLKGLKATRFNLVMVLHCNHPNEINEEVIQEAILPLREAYIPILNQTVLLQGINHQASTLIRLSKKLFAAGILPYYLHQLDRVQGAAHFAVSDEAASALIWEMMRQLPGYLVPKLVREVPFEPCKMPIIDAFPPFHEVKTGGR